MTPYRALIGSVVVTAGLAACGDTGSSSATDATEAPTGPAVKIVATDLAFDADAYDASAGIVTIDYRNAGNLPHTLVIEDVAGFKLDVPRKGAADEGTKALKAGSYVVYCDIPGHREAGMEATLRVA